jgi:DNA gyrase subunit A
MVQPDDEVFAITSAGGVIRTSASEIKISGRQTMGVRLVNLSEGQSLVAIARNADEAAVETAVAGAAPADGISGELADLTVDEIADPDQSPANEAEESDAE